MTRPIEARTSSIALVSTFSWARERLSRSSSASSLEPLCLRAREMLLDLAARLLDPLELGRDGPAEPFRAPEGLEPLERYID